MQKRPVPLTQPLILNNSPSLRSFAKGSSMTYLCLTVLENLAKPPSSQAKRPTFKKRQAAAAKYQIEEDVLNEIGRLSTTKGGHMEGRKEEALTDDLTHEERRFLKHAIKKMIRRMAEKAHCPEKNLPEISLSNLPKSLFLKSSGGDFRRHTWSLAPSDPSHHEPTSGQLHPGHRTCHSPLYVLGKTTAASHPREGSLHYPTT